MGSFVWIVGITVGGYTKLVQRNNDWNTFCRLYKKVTKAMIWSKLGTGYRSKHGLIRFEFIYFDMKVDWSHAYIYGNRRCMEEGLMIWMSFKLKTWEWNFLKEQWSVPHSEYTSIMSYVFRHHKRKKKWKKVNKNRSIYISFWNQIYKLTSYYKNAIKRSIIINNDKECITFTL